MSLERAPAPDANPDISGLHWNVIRLATRHTQWLLDSDEQPRCNCSNRRPGAERHRAQHWAHTGLGFTYENLVCTDGRHIGNTECTLLCACIPLWTAGN